MNVVQLPNKNFQIFEVHWLDESHPSFCFENREFAIKQRLIISKELIFTCFIAYLNIKPVIFYSIYQSTKIVTQPTHNTGIYLTQ